MDLRTFNLRDWGQRGRVLPGRFFRSGEPGLLPEEERLRTLAPLGLKTVIDLRTAAERAIGGYQTGLPEVQHFSLPLFTEIPASWSHPRDRSPRATAERYREMAEAGAPTVIRIVEGLGQTGTAPVLIHCAAGRDRTGVVVACLLRLLGAEENEIVADYALSRHTSDGVAADPRVMEEFLLLFHRVHGSMEGFLSSRGLSPQALEALTQVR